MKDLFLCHTGADKPWVEALATRVEQETARGRPLEVFFDKWDIDQGENILTKLEEALRTARFVGVVMSPAFARADWPRLEWQSRVWQDPTGKAASILPILLHTHDPETGEALEIPLPLRLLRWFDFTNPKRFEAEFQELLRRLRGEPPRRGGGGHGGGGGLGRGGPGAPGPLAFVPPEAPDRCEESLVSNLLQVRRHPARVWSDLTPARSHGDVWKVLTGKFRPPFVLDGGRLYCFYPPGAPDHPFRTLLTGRDPRDERPVDWLADPVRARWLLWMYNDAFREYAYHLGVRTPRRAGQKRTAKEAQQFFCATFDGKPREFRWAPTARPRTLAKVATRPDGTTFGVHQAARMRFLGLGGDAYLLVEPGWFFTEDGATPLEGRLVGILSTKWGGRERNEPVLRNLLMWGLLLSKGQATIDVPLGADTLVLDAVPAHARAFVGVDGDQTRLDRILRGEGAAGEFAPAAGSASDGSPYADDASGGEAAGDDDLDHLIALEASGALEIVLDAEATAPETPAERRDALAGEHDRAEDDAASAVPGPGVEGGHGGSGRPSAPPPAGAPRPTPGEVNAGAQPGGRRRRAGSGRGSGAGARGRRHDDVGIGASPDEIELELPF